ncbi:hypothetical protein M707_23655 [Arthrobacter sp. AK-YN10]|nr:hypothetical protein M707_23655 [Arthrobacter sp. AK-YN10]
MIVMRDNNYSCSFLVPRVRATRGCRSGLHSARGPASPPPISRGSFPAPRVSSTWLWSSLQSFK